MKCCFNCGKEGSDLFGYSVCDACKKKLRLFSDTTIGKYTGKNREQFAAEIRRRLEFLEKDYIRKRLRLLHIQKQLNDT